MINFAPKTRQRRKPAMSFPLVTAISIETGAAARDGAL
jgi:hypothetical protein